MVIEGQSLAIQQRLTEVRLSVESMREQSAPPTMSHGSRNDSMPHNVA